jgi:hypothetical protein
LTVSTTATPAPSATGGGPWKCDKKKIVKKYGTYYYILLTTHDKVELYRDFDVQGVWDEGFWVREDGTMSRFRGTRCIDTVRLPPDLGKKAWLAAKTNPNFAELYCQLQSLFEEGKRIVRERELEAAKTTPADALPIDDIAGAGFVPVEEITKTETHVIVKSRGVYYRSASSQLIEDLLALVPKLEEAKKDGKVLEISIKRPKKGPLALWNWRVR